ncbi:hypothetical protein HQ529_02175 [Candidatus Woesearchaeota archaeon]|nr:hypothetical protein [Candidatus Woesearchaeota archaeon]
MAKTKRKANIIVDSIPGMGKTELLQQVQKYFKQEFNGDVHIISLGDLFEETPREVMYTKKRHIPKIDYLLKQMNRNATIEKAKNHMLQHQNESIIIDTPLTIFAGEQPIPNIVRLPSEFTSIDDIRSIDTIVSVINAPEIVAEKLKHTPYSHKIGELLDWIALDTEIAKSHAMSLTDFNKRKQALYSQIIKIPQPVLEEYVPELYSQIREFLKQDPTSHYVNHIVMPKQNAVISLLKLLYDYKDNGKRSVVVYAAGPITSVKVKDGEKGEIVKEKLDEEKRINEFSRKLQEYGLIVNPIVLADTTYDDKGKAHTTHRDLNYFVPYSDLIIAFYPSNRRTIDIEENETESGKEIIKTVKDGRSIGTETEMRYALMMGKPVILIHPTKEDMAGDVFGIQPTVHFRHEDEFLEALTDLEHSKINENPVLMRDLRMLLGKDGKPKYHDFGEIIKEFYQPFVINNQFS